jgi:hypothetical protein
MGKHDHDWSKRPADNRMRYEKGGTMVFDQGSEAYRRKWAAIFEPSPIDIREVGGRLAISYEDAFRLWSQREIEGMEHCPNHAAVWPTEAQMAEIVDWSKRKTHKGAP